MHVSGPKVIPNRQARDPVRKNQLAVPSPLTKNKRSRKTKTPENIPLKTKRLHRSTAKQISNEARKKRREKKTIKTKTKRAIM